MYLQELGNGISHTNAYRRVELVEPGAGKELVGMEVIGLLRAGRRVMARMASRVRVVSNRRTFQPPFHQVKKPKLVIYR
jgi:hypothetical protein